MCAQLELQGSAIYYLMVDQAHTVAETDSNGATPLQIAAANKHWYTLQDLLRYSDPSKLTLEHSMDHSDVYIHAIEKPNMEMIELLLTFKLNYDAAKVGKVANNSPSLIIKKLFGTA